MDAATLFTKVLALSTLLGNVFLASFLLLALTQNPVARVFSQWMTRHALWLGLFLSSASTVGSLLYSEVVGFPACILCWTQRIFMYPLMFLFALALYRRDRNIIPYALLLSVLGAAVGLYQWVKDMLAVYSHTSLPCPAVSNLPSCDKIYILEYGYITIPMLSLSAFALLILVLFVAVRSRKG